MNEHLYNIITVTSVVQDFNPKNRGRHIWWLQYANTYHRIFSKSDNTPKHYCTLLTIHRVRCNKYKNRNTKKKDFQLVESSKQRHIFWKHETVQEKISSDTSRDTCPCALCLSVLMLITGTMQGFLAIDRSKHSVISIKLGNERPIVQRIELEVFHLLKGDKRCML